MEQAKSQPMLEDLVDDGWGKEGDGSTYVAAVRLGN